MEQKRIRLQYNDDDYAKIMGVHIVQPKMKISPEIDLKFLNTDQVVISAEDMKKLLEHWKGEPIIQRHKDTNNSYVAWIRIPDVKVKKVDNMVNDFAPNNSNDCFA